MDISKAIALKICICIVYNMYLSSKPYIFQFSEFMTEPGDDEVMIFVGGRTPSAATYAARLSGEINGSSLSYTSYNNYLIVTFTSDTDDQKRGFHGNWTAGKVVFVVHQLQQLPHCYVHFRYGRSEEGFHANWTAGRTCS